MNVALFRNNMRIDTNEHVNKIYIEIIYLFSIIKYIYNIITIIFYFVYTVYIKKLSDPIINRIENIT